MDTRQLNQISTGSAITAIVAGLASAAPLGDPWSPLLAVLGFIGLGAALYTVRPDHWEAETEDAQRATGPGYAVGVATTVLSALVVLLLAAAVFARISEVTYLGSVPLYLAENFATVTGPFTALLGTGVLLATQGHLLLEQPPNPNRRIVGASILGFFTFIALYLATGLPPGQPWQAPYILALAGVGAWIESHHFAGVPKLGEFGRWLERGDTESSRQIMRLLALAGNGTVIVLALAGAVLFLLDLTAAAVATTLLAAMVLTVSTHAASRLRRALPEELEEDLGSAQDRKEQLKLLALAPLISGGLALLLTLLAFWAALTSSTSLLELLDLGRPAMGAMLIAMAGVNLVRARLRSYDKHDAVRRAVSAVSISILAASVFFSLLVDLGIMSGPVTETGTGLLFNYAAILAASVFVLARGLYPVPVLEGLIPEKSEHDEYSETDLESSLLYVYIAAGAFVLGVIGLLSAVMLGGVNFGFTDSPQGRNAAFLGLLAMGMLLLVGLLAVYFRTRQFSTVPTEQVTFEKKYTPQEVLRLTVLGFSGTIAFVLALLGLLVMAGQLTSIGSMSLESKHSTDFFVFAVLIGIGPAGYLHNRERKRIQAIDKRLPEFLRDLAESQRTGMTLTQAVITSSKGNYGALTPEIQKMAAQIEWGVSFEDALESFAERVDTPLVNRTVSLVNEASKSGGDVMDVLTAAADDAREIQMIDAERKGGMQIYVMIIYIAFFVFLGVIAILNVKFMPEVSKAVAGAEGVSIGSVTFKEFDMQMFRTLFFHASVIQGLGGGFVAGSMEEGKPVAGLKHAFAMTIIAYVVFRFLLGG